MPRSGPPIFDDGGDLPDVDRTTRRRGSGSRRGHSDEWDDHGDGRGRGDDDRGDRGDGGVPNYLVRRATVVGAVVILIAAAAVGAGMLLGGNGDGSGSAFGDSDWNTAVSIDGNVGTIVLTNGDGEETDRFRTGVQPLSDSTVVGSTAVALAADGVAIVDLEQPDEITTIELATNGPLLRPSGTVDTVITKNASSARAVLVHGPTGEVIDTADLDTVPGARYDAALARSDASGRHVLVTDSGNFQSVLFSFDRDAPSFFPGLALAVDESLVVTAQNVGTNANISVFDHDGEPGVSTQTASVRAGMIADGDVILVGIDGEVLSLSIGSGEVTELDSLNVGTVESGHVALRGDRLIVSGDRGTSIIDGDGLVIAELPGAVPTSTGVDVIAPSRTECVIVAREATGEVVVVALADGTILAEALADPEVLASVSGCRPVVPTTAGYISLTQDAVEPITIDGEVVAISPDGGTLVVEDNNRVVLTERMLTSDDTDEADEAVDIGRAGRTVAFADL